MSKTAFTPGPWVANRHGDVFAGQDFICCSGRSPGLWHGRRRLASAGHGGFALMHKHSDMQARADSMRGFYERQKSDIAALQKRRAEADAAYREARDDFRWQLCHFKRAEARQLHRQIDRKLVELKSIKHTLRKNQDMADRQRLAQTAGYQAAAE